MVFWRVAAVSLWPCRGHFIELPGLRCTELPQHPLGSKGDRWSDDLELDARNACDDTDSCTGFMRYTGDNDQHCFDWCGRPQFCMPVSDQDKRPFAPNAAWTSYVKSEYLEISLVASYDAMAIYGCYALPIRDTMGH